MSDRKFRQLERAYNANPCKDTREPYHAEIVRAGYCSGPVSPIQISLPLHSHFNWAGMIAIAFDLRVPVDLCHLCKLNKIYVKLQYGTVPFVDVGTFVGISGGKMYDKTVGKIKDKTLILPLANETYSASWDYRADGVQLPHTAWLEHQLVGPDEQQHG